jgi:small conductance mechanosensitive channel
VEFLYNEFGDSSINFVVRFWTNVTSNRDILMAKSAAIIAIKKVYDEHDVNIPFPIRTLEFNNKLNIQKPSSEGE